MKANRYDRFSLSYQYIIISKHEVKAPVTIFFMGRRETIYSMERRLFERHHQVSALRLPSERVDGAVGGPVAWSREPEPGCDLLARQVGVHVHDGWEPLTTAPRRFPRSRLPVHRCGAASAAILRLE